MTRPRHEVLEFTAESQLERLRENHSRRELMRLFGAAGAAAIAGCGGGGQETASPSPTPGGGQETTQPRTSTPGEEDTPTEEPDTPTPTETEAETDTRSGGGYELADRRFQDITTQNFEQFTPNPWNAETGFNPKYQTCDLVWIPSTAESGPSWEESKNAILLQSARKIELDTNTNRATIELRDDLTWGDGSEFNADNVLMHVDIIRSQIELGESSESTLPLSIEATGEYTLDAQLLPGNAIIRMFTALFQGNFQNVSNTHPKLHRTFVEAIRSATTNSETQTALQKLFGATFPKSDLPKMALGPNKPVKWNPTEMIFDARTDWPWGLNYYPDISKIWRGVRYISIGEQQQINAEVAGKSDYATLPNSTVFQRFDQSKWKMFNTSQSSQSAIFFSPKSPWGKKGERPRKLRKAVAYLFDIEEFATVNDLGPSWEPTCGFGKRQSFDNWIGIERYKQNWTNYGNGDDGYVRKDKGYQRLRDAGFEQNKNGAWVDAASGDPLAPNLLLALIDFKGITRPVVNNLVEQLNRHGIKASGKIREGEAFENRIQSYEGWDITLTDSQTEVHPHPYFGYREDMGLGSKDGLPSGVASWDWRNGIRRVKVPIPVGNPDGELVTFDWDKNVLEMVEITDQEKMKSRIRTLSWVLNQWVPAVFVVRDTVDYAIRTDRIRTAPNYNVDWFDTGRDMQWFLMSGAWRPA